MDDVKIFLDCMAAIFAVRLYDIIYDAIKDVRKDLRENKTLK